MVPYEHHVYWHNAICPEQNYGILANETVKPENPDIVMTEANEETLRKIEIFHDATYLYMDLFFSKPISLEQYHLKIGIDTYDPFLGSYRYSPSLLFHAPTGMEFLLDFSAAKAELRVNPGYNIGQMKFSSQVDYSGVFEVINPIINKERVTQTDRFIPEIRDNGSVLSEGYFLGSTHNFYWEDSRILHIRIPWGRLNVTDPTSLVVLDDGKKYNYYPDRDQFATKVSSGFLITAVMQNSQGAVVDVFPGTVRSQQEQVVKWETLEPYTWNEWTWAIPPYQQRRKASWEIIRKYFQEIEP